MRTTDNIREHSSCYNYVRDTNRWVERYQYPRGYSWEHPVMHTEILFVLEGELFISYDSYLENRIEKGQMLLLYAGIQFKASTKEGVSVAIFHLHDIVYLCDRMPFSSLTSRKVTTAGIPLLEIKPIVSTFLTLFLETYSRGLHCSKYLSLKIKEFFFLLRGYYTKEELSIFFRPVLNRNLSFAAFVLDNYQKVRTVAGFADLYSCSISSFDKKFKRAFGTSAYQWMIGRKTELLFHEINTTSKTFRQISEEQGFASLSQFTDFCKKHLGEAPSRIRHKERIDDV